MKNRWMGWNVISLGVLGALMPVWANEALDVLEGRKKASEVMLPPAVDAEGVPVVADGPVEMPVMIWASNPWDRHLDPVWSKAVLFEDPKSPWVQQVALSGLFQWQAVWGEASRDGGSDLDLDSTRTRRARLGARLKAFGNTDVEAVVEVAGGSPHRGLERLMARTEVVEGWGVSYGKMQPRFSLEGRVDPARSIVPEGSFLSNMLAPSSTLGIMIDRDTDTWDWAFGWFSSDRSAGFSGWEGDGFLLANVAHESVLRGKDGGAYRTRWHADYLYNFDANDSDVIPRYRVAGRRSANGNQLIASNPAFRHLFSAGVELEQDRFSFGSDFLLANGESDAWGVTLMPRYWAIPGRLQVVGRYHFADTDQAGGLVGGLGTSGDPYFDASPLFVGDEFQSFYLGANLHLYRDDFVIMNGIEHARIKDEAGAGFNSDAWIWHTGARLSF